MLVVHEQPGGSQVLKPFGNLGRTKGKPQQAQGSSQRHHGKLLLVGLPWRKAASREHLGAHGRCGGAKPGRAQTHLRAGT